jgi:hypothetical protein
LILKCSMNKNSYTENMRKLLLLLIALPLAAQTTHSVTLAWVDTLNPSGTTYTVYRAPGLCSGSPVFAKLATAIPVLTYIDSTVTPGNYCFEVTALFNAMESSPSPTAPAAVPSFPPTQIQTTVK